MSPGSLDIFAEPPFRPAEVGGIFVERRFCGGEADLDALVEALSNLLLGSAAQPSCLGASLTETAEMTCLPEPSRVRNVS